MDFISLKIETFIPEEFIDKLRDALNDIGALTIGNYDSCMAVSKVRGTWRPLQGANPFEGTIGKLSEAEEFKVEFNCKKELAKEVLITIRRVHPYEEPVINVLPLYNHLFE